MIGGPNGSGKSTLISYLLEDGADLGVHLNADEIARDELASLPPVEAARTAQAIVRRRRDELLAQNRDYSWETVMSHESHVEHLGEAARAGYEVHVVYVCIDDPEVNVGRVEERVEAGGHPVRESDIRTRYARSLKNLSAAIVVSHQARIFDNSSAEVPMRPVASWDGATLLLLSEPCPNWFVEVIAEFESYGIHVVQV